MVPSCENLSEREGKARSLIEAYSKQGRLKIQHMGGGGFNDYGLALELYIARG